ncbi:phosphatidylserine decarboxylase family protein [bacterium]|nr:phosphatidylserine decarboxylase family protein [bacterium]
MRVSKEGYATIAIVSSVVIVTFILLFFLQKPTLTYSVMIPLLAIEALIIYFFRDPDRTIPEDENVIVSPADGRVVLIQPVRENKFLKDEAIQISIFLSVFNVHVNRIPVSGTVKYFEYMKGQFLAAFKETASRLNEQTIIGIQSPQCKILFKQIAGLLARRIVCIPRENERVVKGDRFGIIKFGSRVDVIVPKNVEIKLKVGDRVIGGTSVIGIIHTNASNGDGGFNTNSLAKSVKEKAEV